MKREAFFTADNFDITAGKAQVWWIKSNVAALPWLADTFKWNRDLIVLLIYCHSDVFTYSPWFFEQSRLLKKILCPLACILFLLTFLHESHIYWMFLCNVAVIVFCVFLSGLFHWWFEEVLCLDVHIKLIRTEVISFFIEQHLIICSVHCMETLSHYNISHFCRSKFPFVPYWKVKMWFSL